MSENKIYGEVYFGIPLNAPYEDGILVRNPGAKSPRVKDKNGKAIPYHKWEKLHFAKAIGRPMKYNDEERAEMRKVYAKTYNTKKRAERKVRDDLRKAERAKELAEMISKIVIIGSK